ncbi:peroxiredoxin [Halococcus thailandensis]|uniref:thioredoxin-dependent peroxiredoxin n=1 Tax=Halococcus thailandensis JCM 13552 TaxID=1227457 RepID=M0N3C3_9EURY|nr:peroxiredoxin [Halococcus thailandensis]EMA51609.1 peroxiredoxin (thioredoxin-dependent hydroperoxide peroxidase) [Halococcus thailandensis JCM 13552]
MPQVGQTAPAFSLQNQDGESVSLSEFEGQRTVLYFYPKAGTEGCTIEANNFGDAFDEFEQHDAQVLGVSTDSVADLAAFRDDEELPFTLLSDEDGSVAEKYDSAGDGTALRNTFVIGPNGDIEAVYEDVSPGEHAEQVLDDVAAREVA